MLDFTNQTAIITGSSTGIGAAAALAMAGLGGRVVINYANNAEAAATLVAACEKAGGEAVAVKADVAQESNCQALIDAAMDKWGRLDIVVNNAGTTKFMDHDDLDGLSKQDFEDIYALNVIGAYQMVKLARKHLKKSEAPAIVNTSSVAGVRGIGSSIAYAASKGALNTLTLSLARALGADNIRVNAVCPGFVGTDWFRNALGEDAFDRIMKAQKKVAPLGRAGDADDIRGAILFFASRMSQHITGQLLVVDGGMLLGMPQKLG
ncbi:MAG: SDR family oxidoreductase [Alphaproteobacteria bacterium]|nr:SDR family oxidoreductase [Alphaproteobacteria bacterium]